MNEIWLFDMGKHVWDNTELKSQGMFFYSDSKITSFYNANLQCILQFTEFELIVSMEHAE